MANDAGDLIDAADLESPNLNPAYSLDPTYAIRAVPLTTKEVFPETSSALLAPLSTTYTPPGTRIASLAPVPGQSADATIIQGADLSVPQPRVAPVIPAGSVAPQVQIAQAGPPVAPPQRAPSPAPGTVPPRPVPGPIPYQQKNAPETDDDQRKMDQLKLDAERLRSQGWGANRLMFDETAAKEDQKKWHDNQDEIAKVQQRLDAKAYNRQLAIDSGVRRPVSNTEGQAALYEYQKQEWANDGNFRAYRSMLGSGHADNIKIYDTKGFNALGKDVVKADEAFALLDKNGSENDYRKNREQALEKAKKVYNAEDFGLTDGNIPTTKKEWMDKRSVLMATKNDAADLVAGFKNAQENRGVPQIITDEKAAGAITGQFMHQSSGDSFPNLKAVKLNDGKMGGMGPPGSADIGAWGDQGYGKPVKASDMNEDKYKKVKDMFGAEQEKGAINKYKMSADFYKTVMNDENFNNPAAVAAVYDKLGGVFSNVAEAAQGSGKIGFTRQLEHQFGSVGNALNTLYANGSELQAWLNSGMKGDAPKPQPRVTPQTIQGFRQIAKFEVDMNKEQLKRLAGPIAFLGRNGGSLSGTGLDEEAQQLLQPLLDEATQAARLDKDQYPARIHGNQRIYLPQGTTGPGVIPAGSYAKHVGAIIDPTGASGSPAVPPPPPPPPPAAARPAAPAPFGAGAAPIPFAPNAPAVAVPPLAPAPAAPQRRSMLDMINPISSAHAEEAPPAPAPAATAPVAQGLPASWGVGAGAAPAATPQPAIPATVQQQAGGQVPAGFNQSTYEAGLTAGESGGRNLPPKTAGGASGIYQFLKSTWAENKPPDAPDEAYKATPAQQKQAFDTFNTKNAAALQSSGIPVNNFTMAVAHQQGAGGAKSLLNAPDGDIALNHVVRENAAANPQFFWDANGKQLTVAESKAKFEQFYRTGGGAGTRSTNSIPYPNPQSDKERAANIKAGYSLTDAERAGNVTQLKKDAAHLAVPVGQTVGSIGGTLATGGPWGGVAGGAIGGTLGGLAENYLTGDPETQNPAGYITSGAKGGIQGAIYSAPGTGPIAAGARVVGGALTEGGAEYLKSGDAKRATVAAGAGAVGGLLGEAVGATISKAAGAAWHALPLADQDALKDAAKVLAEQKIHIAQPDGTIVVNQAYRDAEQLAVSKGIHPQVLAHAYNTAILNPTTRGEAITTRPGEVARMEAANQLETTKNLVGVTGASQNVTPRNPAPSPTLTPTPNGPLAAIQNPAAPGGRIGPQYKTEATQAEGLVQLPAKNMGERFGNMAEARSTLLDHERTALRNGDTDKAKAMRALADTVRGQQEEMVRHLLPGPQADKLMEHLAKVDRRYRDAVMAGGHDVVGTIAAGGQKGMEAKRAFDALAENDIAAKNMMNALTRSINRKQEGAKLGVMISAATGAFHFIPVVGQLAAGVGATMSVAKASQMIMDFARQKAAGKMVTFKEMVQKDISGVQGHFQRASGATGVGAGEIALDRFAPREPTRVIIAPPHATASR